MFIVSNKNITHACNPNIVSNKNITHVCDSTPILTSGRQEYIIQYIYTCLVNYWDSGGVLLHYLCKLQSICRLIDSGGSSVSQNKLPQLILGYIYIRSVGQS